MGGVSVVGPVEGNFVPATGIRRRAGDSPKSGRSAALVGVNVLWGR